MSTNAKSIVRTTWILIILGFVVRLVMAIAGASGGIELALYLLGPYIVLALGNHFLATARAPAITMLVGTIATILVTVLAILGIEEIGWGFFLVPAAQLIVAVVTVVVALVLKLVGRRP